MTSPTDRLALEDEKLRWALRRAGEILRGPARTARLDRRGITVGAGDRVSMVELLAALEPDSDPQRPCVVVTAAADLAGDHARLEADLALFVEDEGLGEWIGGSASRAEGRPLCHIRFAIDDLELAIPRLQAKLRALGAGAETRLQTSNGDSYPVWLGS